MKLLISTDEKDIMQRGNVIILSNDAFQIVSRFVLKLAAESRPTLLAADVCPRAPANGPHSWYESGDGTLCEHCGTRR